jgi:hypothetical protein
MSNPVIDDLVKMAENNDNDLGSDVAQMRDQDG